MIAMFCGPVSIVNQRVFQIQLINQEKRRPLNFTNWWPCIISVMCRKYDLISKFYNKTLGNQLLYYSHLFQFWSSPKICMQSFICFYNCLFNRALFKSKVGSWFVCGSNEVRPCNIYLIKVYCSWSRRVFNQCHLGGATSVLVNGS